MNILIIADPLDLHADAVNWGLAKLGYTVTVWNWADFPISDSGVFEINRNAQKYTMTNLGQRISSRFDVIWVRRKEISTPFRDCHKDDREMVLKESAIFLESVLPYLGHENTKWINDIEADRLAGNKINQICVALKVGFAVPDTIIGNDYDGIENFFDEHKGKVIFKAFSPKMWLNDDGSSTVQRTSQINQTQILNDYAIRACPGIYQKLIEKKYELRITVIGETVIPAKLDSQKFGATVDWRYDTDGGKETLTTTTIPGDIAEKCRLFCKEMKLNFGAFDFIVTKDDEYYFLEVNPAGQFLWGETYDPSIGLLDEFCRFVVSHDPKFISGTGERLTLQNYEISDHRKIQREKFREASRRLKLNCSGK